MTSDADCGRRHRGRRGRGRGAGPGRRRGGRRRRRPRKRAVQQVQRQGWIGLSRMVRNGTSGSGSVPDRCGPVEMVANGISGGKSADTKGRQGEEEPALPEECACAGRGGRVEVVVGRMPGAVGGGEKGEEESLAQHVGTQRGWDGQAGVLELAFLTTLDNDVRWRLYDLAPHCQRRRGPAQSYRTYGPHTVSTHRAACGFGLTASQARPLCRCHLPGADHR